MTEVKTVRHGISKYKQTNSFNCSQTALAMVLSFHNIQMTPDEVTSVAPIVKDERGSPTGSINQQLATAAIIMGFKAELYSSDCQILDLTWRNMRREQVLERMKLAYDHRVIPSLGQHFSRRYMRSYIDFLEAGGNLHILPYIGTSLLKDLIKKSPILATVCHETMYGVGQSAASSPIQDTAYDDIRGTTGTHSVVAYGIDEYSQVLIADPWYGEQTVQPEQLVCAIQAAQIECDNLIIQLERPLR